MTPCLLALAFDDARLLLLLVFVPLLALWLRLHEARNNRRVRTELGARAHDIATRTPHGLRRAALLAHLLALASLVFALAGPRHGERSGDDDAASRLDIVLCLDVSRSMRARDLEPDRLGFAHALVRRIAELARGDRLALVAFAGEARLIVPLTEDATSLAWIAARTDESITLRGGTDMAAALATALGALPEESARGAAIVLLTDGEDLAGAGLAAAATCRDRAVPILALGLGSPLGSKIPLRGARGETFLKDEGGEDVVSTLDVAGLEAIVRTAGGRFVAMAGDAASAQREVEAAFEANLRPLARPVRRSEAASAASAVSLLRARDQGFLVMALLCFVAGLALAEHGVRRRTLAVHPQRAPRMRTTPS